MKEELIKLLDELSPSDIRLLYVVALEMKEK